MTAAPIDGDICLVRDFRYPGEGPELARFVAAPHIPNCEHWQFFGTDDDAKFEDVEIVAHVVAVRTRYTQRACCEGDFVITEHTPEDRERIAARIERW